MPLYIEEINMLEGLEDMELKAYLAENPWIIQLFKINVLETASEYGPTSALKEDDYEPDPESMVELSRACEAFIAGDGNLAKSHNVNLEGNQCRVNRGTKATNDCKGLDAK